tara:strand:- start:3626 stop:5680 length:2055 start_codon:yes stop_codon:yes gene_type:complete
MVERVTQRANFGNLRPQARPVDTFRRQDTRDLDNFIEFANQRLKATQGIIDAGFGAYQTYRESKEEDVRLKARADAVKNYYNPLRAEDPNVDLDTESSFASYDKEVQRIQSGLDGIEDGRKLLNDDKKLNDIFIKFDKRKKDGDKDVTEEQLFKEFKERQFSQLPKNADAFYLEKYTEAFNQFEDKFFERLLKRTEGQKVQNLSRLNNEWLKSKARTFETEIDPDDINANFYGQLGLMLEQGRKMGLKESHAQAIIINDIFRYADSFLRPTDTQNAGEITDREEEILTDILTALQANDVNKSFVKSGGNIASNAFFEQVAQQGISNINTMLKNKDSKDDTDSRKTNILNGNQATDDLYQDIYSGKITTLVDLNKKIDELQLKDWNIDFNLPVADILRTFNSYTTSGGNGDTERFAELQIEILTGKVTTENLINDPKYFKTGKNKNLDFNQQIKLVDLLFNSDAGPLQTQKVELKGLEAYAHSIFGGKESFLYNLSDPAFLNAYRSIQLEFNRDVELFIKEKGFTKQNKPSIQQEIEFFKEMRPKYIQRMNELQSISTNLETNLNQAKIDVRNIEGTLPDMYKTLENGVPEAFYRDTLYFTNRDLWEELFEGDYSRPKAQQLYANAGAGFREKINMLEEVQKYLFNTDDPPPSHFTNWINRKRNEKPSLSLRFWRMLTPARNEPK